MTCPPGFTRFMPLERWMSYTTVLISQFFRLSILTAWYWPDGFRQDATFTGKEDFWKSRVDDIEHCRLASSFRVQKPRLESFLKHIAYSLENFSIDVLLYLGQMIATISVHLDLVATLRSAKWWLSRNGCSMTIIVWWNPIILTCYRPAPLLGLAFQISWVFKTAVVASSQSWYVAAKWTSIVADFAILQSRKTKTRSWPCAWLFRIHSGCLQNGTSCYTSSAGFGYSRL